LGKRAELEIEAIRLYADGMEIPAISTAIGVSENSLRDWKKRAGTEWDDARRAARVDQIAAIEDVGSRMRRSRELAAKLQGSAKDQGTMGLILNQTLQTMLYDLMGQVQTTGLIDGENMGATLAQVDIMTRALQRIEQSAGLNLKREAEIRQQERERAAEQVDKIAKKGGLSSSTVQEIRRQILGINE
jgi:hypothetical protein